MMMRQMMVLMVLAGSVVSTGCGVCRIGDVIKAYTTTTSSMPSWMAQEEGVVVHDVPSSTLRVHIGPSGIQDVGMQRMVCANRARHAMAVYMGWASTQATTTRSGTSTTTTTRHQITMGHDVGRTVNVNMYYDGDHMLPVIHCVGIVKVKPTTSTTPVE